MLLSRINIILILLVATQISKTNTRKKIPQNVKKLVPYFREVILRIPAIKNFTLTIPEDCKKIGICDHIPNYPQKAIDFIIEKLRTMKNVVFNTDIKPMSANFFYDTYSESEIKLCPSQSSIYPPQGALDVNLNWRVVLNTLPSTPIQSFYVTICDKIILLACVNIWRRDVDTDGGNSPQAQRAMERAMLGVSLKDKIRLSAAEPNSTPNPCNETNTPYGYKAECKQKWLFRNMYALNIDLDEVVKESLRMPICCVCDAILQN